MTILLYLLWINKWLGCLLRFSVFCELRGKEQKHNSMFLPPSIKTPIITRIKTNQSRQARKDVGISRRVLKSLESSSDVFVALIDGSQNMKWWESVWKIEFAENSSNWIKSVRLPVEFQLFYCHDVFEGSIFYLQYIWIYFSQVAFIFKTI